MLFIYNMNQETINCMIALISKKKHPEDIKFDLYRVRIETLPERSVTPHNESVCVYDVFVYKRLVLF